VPTVKKTAIFPKTASFMVKRAAFRAYRTVQKIEQLFNTERLVKNRFNKSNISFDFFEKI
jgi:hypothetical protein